MKLRSLKFLHFLINLFCCLITLVWSKAGEKAARWGAPNISQVAKGIPPKVRAVNWVNVWACELD